MQLTVTGKQVDVGAALRRYIDSALETILGKYFGTAIEAHAVFARDAHGRGDGNIGWNDAAFEAGRGRAAPAGRN